jgi:hypothetical protein
MKKTTKKDTSINDKKLKEINDRINKEICSETLKKLTDENLMNEYMKSESVKRSIENLKEVLDKNEIDDEKINNIIKDYLLKLIPPGTKGVIRGNKFNNIIKDYIINLKLDTDIYDIQFETKHKEFLTDEIPDWYIYNKKTKKIIIGMNQLSLWGGGQQTNRGSKYIQNCSYNSNTVKLLCVVANDIKITSVLNKEYKLFETGFNNNTLCYLNGLKDVINKFNL